MHPFLPESHLDNASLPRSIDLYTVARLTEQDSPSPSVPAPAKEAAPAPAASRGTQRARGGPASRGGRYYPRGGKTTAPREGQNGEATEDAAGEPRKRCESYHDYRIWPFLNVAPLLFSTLGNE